LSIAKLPIAPDYPYWLGWQASSNDWREHDIGLLCAQRIFFHNLKANSSKSYGGFPYHPLVSGEPLVKPIKIGVIHRFTDLSIYGCVASRGSGLFSCVEADPWTRLCVPVA
jgi:hypothetical protein